MLARYAHGKLKPYFPKITKLSKESFAVVEEIITRRFYTPVKDLLTELMFRPTNKLLEGITAEDEEQSLDNMLRDLNFGDGTPEDRHDAIIKAMRQYEHDMNSGLLWHPSRLIRLILIQVQQLKCGMLHATDTVDLLFQANRFNFQLLTIIPAIVIVTIGTKLFVRTLFTLRVRDIRPLSSVHSEMAEYLNNLESILLLADRSNTESRPAHEALTDKELGEFVNTVYDYLVLLDYASPQPFPSWQCDSIHQSMTEFLHSMKRLSLDDQVKLIDQVKRKHVELAKHL